MVTVDTTGCVAKRHYKRWSTSIQADFMGWVNCADGGCWCLLQAVLPSRVQEKFDRQLHADFRGELY